jgi:hypothetical protein
MTRIYLSAKLQKLFPPLAPPAGADLPGSVLGDWNAHLFTVDRRKCVVLVNNKSYYAMFMAGILKKDLKNFPEIFLAHLLRQLAYDKILDAPQSALIQKHYGQPMLLRTNNDKKALGTINDFIFQFRAHCGGQPLDTIDLAAINHFINNAPAGAGRTDNRHYGWPAKDMKELLSHPG